MHRHRRRGLSAIMVLGAVVLAAVSGACAEENSSNPIADADPTSTSTAQEPVRVDGQVYEVAVTEGIEFARGALRNGSDLPLLLDLYEPVGAPQPHPVLLTIHGGGFLGGSRTAENSVTVAEGAAQRGYVAISIDYRLAGSDPEPAEGPLLDLIGGPEASGLFRSIVAAVEDGYAALDWLGASRSDLDWSRLVVGGGSAGGITASNMAYVAPHVGAAQTRPIAAVLNFWGGINLAETEEVVSAGDPPAFIVHGTGDPTVPFEWSESLAEELASEGVTVGFHPIDQDRHGFDITTTRSESGDLLVDELWRFLASLPG